MGWQVLGLAMRRRGFLKAGGATRRLRVSRSPRLGLFVGKAPPTAYGPWAGCVFLRCFRANLGSLRKRCVSQNYLFEKIFYETNSGCTRVSRTAFSFAGDAGCCCFLSGGTELDELRAHRRVRSAAK